MFSSKSLVSGGSVPDHRQDLGSVWTWHIISRKVIAFFYIFLSYNTNL